MLMVVTVSPVVSDGGLRIFSCQLSRHVFWFWSASASLSPLLAPGNSYLSTCPFPLLTRLRALEENWLAGVGGLASQHRGRALALHCRQRNLVSYCGRRTGFLFTWLSVLPRGSDTRVVYTVKRTIKECWRATEGRRMPVFILEFGTSRRFDERHILAPSRCYV